MNTLSRELLKRMLQNNTVPRMAIAGGGNYRLSRPGGRFFPMAAWAPQCGNTGGWQHHVCLFPKSPSRFALLRDKMSVRFAMDQHRRRQNRCAFDEVRRCNTAMPLRLRKNAVDASAQQTPIGRVHKYEVLIHKAHYGTDHSAW